VAPFWLHLGPFGMQMLYKIMPSAPEIAKHEETTADNLDCVASMFRASDSLLSSGTFWQSQYWDAYVEEWIEHEVVAPRMLDLWMCTLVLWGRLKAALIRLSLIPDLSHRAAEGRPCHRFCFSAIAWKFSANIYIYIYIYVYFKKAYAVKTEQCNVVKARLWRALLSSIYIYKPNII
jgi:hypothetical protein